MLRRMTGQLWLRSFAKLVTRQITGNTSSKHCLLSELSFSEISTLLKRGGLQPRQGHRFCGTTTFKWQGLNVGTASILSGTYLGWVVLGGGSEARSAQSSCGDRHHLAPASSSGGTRSRTKVCGEQTGGHGAPCSDNELPSELAQVLQSLQQLCRAMCKDQPPSGVSLKLCIARTALVLCFWEPRCSPDNLWDGWRGAGGGEGRKEGSEKIVGCPQTSLSSGGIISIQVSTLVILEKYKLC